MLNPDCITLIQESREAAASTGVLPKPLLDVAFEQRWFDLWVPKQYGGRQETLPAGCRFLEELAYWDGALGWTITLCSGANMFAGYIAPDVAKEVFFPGKTCFGGSGRASGTAVKVDGGYRLTGRWSYATGAPHLTHFTLNAGIRHSGESTSEATEVTSFFVPRAQVLIDPDWQSFGLEATASHSFLLEDVFVPDAHAFQLDPSAAQHEGTLFQFPFQPFAEFTLFVNYLGMFRRYCDLVQKLFHVRSQNEDWQAAYGKRYFRELDQAQQLAEKSSLYIYQAMEEAWQNLEEDKKGDDNANLFQEAGQRMREEVSFMRRIIADLHPKCGMEAARQHSELNQVFRHFFTATQHALLQSEA